MTKQDDDIESEGIGDHAGQGKSAEDLMAEDEHDEELMLVYKSTWAGPYLSFLDAMDHDGSDRVMEAWVSHPKGLLPSSILPQGKAESLEFDPWLREIVCRISLVDSHQLNGKHTYLTRLFVKAPKQDISEPKEVPVVRKTPLIEERNIRPDFDRCPTVDKTGVRGHARGLVSKALLDRLDGVEPHGTHWPMNSRAHELHSEFRVYPATSADLPEDLQTPILNNTHTACVETLLDDVLRRAKSLELELQALNTPVRSYGYPHEWTAQDMLAQETGRLKFSDTVSVIPYDDDLSKSSKDLFSKVAPEYSNRPFTTESVTAEPSDTESLAAEYHDAQSTTAVLPGTGSLIAEYHDAEYTIAVLPATESLNAVNRGIEHTTTALPRIETFTAEYHDVEYTTAVLPATETLTTEYRESQYTNVIHVLTVNQEGNESPKADLPDTDSHTAEFHDAMSTTAVLHDTESLNAEYEDARSTISVLPDTESTSPEQRGTESATAILLNTKSSALEQHGNDFSTAVLPDTKSCAAEQRSMVSTTAVLLDSKSGKVEEYDTESTTTEFPDSKPTAAEQHGTESTSVEPLDTQFTAGQHCIESKTAVFLDMKSSAVQQDGVESTIVALLDSKSTAVKQRGNESTTTVLLDTKSNAGKQYSTESTTADLPDTTPTAVERHDNESTSAELFETRSSAVEELGADSITAKLLDAAKLTVDYTRAESENAGLLVTEYVGLPVKLSLADSLSAGHAGAELESAAQSKAETASTKCLIDTDSLARRVQNRDNDSHVPVVKSRSKRLRSFLLGLLCCIQVRRRSNMKVAK